MEIDLLLLSGVPLSAIRPVKIRGLASAHPDFNALRNPRPEDGQDDRRHRDDAQDEMFANPFG